jgi:hypothetical protein
MARQVAPSACWSAARLSAARDSWLRLRERSAALPSASKAAAALLALAPASRRRALYWLRRWSLLTKCLGDAGRWVGPGAVLDGVPVTISDGRVCASSDGKGDASVAK